MPKFQKYEHPVVIFDRYTSRVHVHNVEVVHERGDFIVHKSALKIPERQKWIVTHKPTGLKAFGLRLKGEAIELCNRLGELPTIDDADDLQFVGTEGRSAVLEYGWKYKAMRVYVLSGEEYANLSKRYEGNRMDKETFKRALEIVNGYRDELNGDADGNRQG